MPFIFPTARFARNSLIWLAAAFTLSACSQSEDDLDTGLIEAEAYLDVAELYRNQGQFRASMIEAQNALQARPNHARTLRLVAQVYMDLGDNVAAADLLGQLLDASPSDMDAELLLAETYLNRGNLDSVLSSLESLTLTDTEQQVQRNWLMGNAYARLGQVQAAQETLRGSLELDPQHTPTLITLSMLEYQGGNEFGSQQYLDQAIEASPNDLDLWIWRGQFALLQQSYEESEDAYFEALQIMGDYDTMTGKRLAVLQAIIAPLQMQQKNQEALRYSQIIAETPQGQLQGSFEDALAMFQSGDFQQASDAIGDVLAMAPDHVGSNLLRGVSQYAVGDYQGAQQSLSGFVNVDSSSPEVIKVLAATHLRMNQPERALSVLQDASAAYPDDSSILAMIGVAYQATGDLEQSIASFSEALGQNSESAEIHYALGSSYYLAGETESAVEQLDRAIGINPDFDRAKETQVGYLFEINQGEQALSKAQQWLSDDPDSALNHSMLGRIEYQLGDLDAAETAFEQSLELNPELLGAQLLLARIDVDRQDYAAASEHIDAVLDIAPDNLQALSSVLALGDLRDSPDTAISRVRALANQRASSFEPPLILALYLQSKGQLDAARPEAETAYARNANNLTTNTLLRIVNQQASRARTEDNVELAREHVAYALEIAPGNVASLIMAAGTESQAGNFTAAETYIDLIKEVEPDNTAIGLEVEGDLLLLQERVEEASRVFREAWTAAPATNLGIKLFQTLNATQSSEEAEEFLREWETALPGDPNANLLWAMKLQENGEDSDAIDRYELSLNGNDSNPVALNNLAWLYQDSNPERAEELAARAADLYPSNADILDTYGWVLFKAGKQDQAIVVLEQAAYLAPESESIAEHLESARQQ